MSDEKKYVNRAIVTLKLEIKLGTYWSEDASLAEVRRQAASDAQDTINRAIGNHTNISIVGEPDVTTIFVKDKR